MWTGVAAAAAAVSAIAAVTVFALLLRRGRIDAKEREEARRREMESLLDVQKTECSRHLEQLGRRLEFLESSAQSSGSIATGGLTRSTRAQAMQMLRSGMSPENIATRLGIGRREMRLIAHVSRTLSLEVDRPVPVDEPAGRRPE